ncbi:unnamed protein product [Cuscuta epithymum]|uniref:Uncharacterized protein n=1 Tax=Cuscuta epithymum TaxID=186058 RepID=A0AAV0CWQ5_9ASTE|nr:unnamed protein product [Cuscuta epithymum]
MAATSRFLRLNRTHLQSLHLLRPSIAIGTQNKLIDISAGSPLPSTNSVASELLLCADLQPAGKIHPRIKIRDRLFRSKYDNPDFGQYGPYTSDDDLGYGSSFDEGLYSDSSDDDDDDDHDFKNGRDDQDPQGKGKRTTKKKGGKA